MSRGIGLSWEGRGPGAALEKFCEDDGGEVQDDVVLGIDAAAFPPIPPFPVPFQRKLAFSFAGLHSAVDRFISMAQQNLPRAENQAPFSPGSNLPHHVRLALARAFQTAAVKQLEEKVVLALNWCREQEREGSIIDTASNGKIGMVKHVVVSGGVASNMFLRKRCVEMYCSERRFSLTQVFQTQGGH